MQKTDEDSEKMMTKKKKEDNIFDRLELPKEISPPAQLFLELAVDMLIDKGLTSHEVVIPQKRYMNVMKLVDDREVVSHAKGVLGELRQVSKEKDGRGGFVNVADSAEISPSRDITFVFGTSFVRLLKELAILDLGTANSFVPMLNGTAINLFMSIDSSSLTPERDDASGDNIIERESLRVFIEKPYELTRALCSSTHKLLDVFIILLTKQNRYRGDESTINPTVEIALDDYLQLCGYKNTKDCRKTIGKQVKADLETLRHISLEWTENFKDKKKAFSKMRFCDDANIGRGKIVFTFSMDMAKYLISSYITQYPLALLKVSQRNPNVYYVFKKLALHAGMKSNIRKGTHNILSVASLLKACPNIPSYDKVKKTDRAMERRIIAPLEAALDSINEFVKWNYCNAKGVPLTDEQMKASNYKTFSKLYIKFSLVGS